MKPALIIALVTTFVLYCAYNCPVTRSALVRIAGISAIVSQSFPALERYQPLPARSAAATRSVRVFAPDSFWYASIPANSPLHENSRNFVAEFLRQKAAHYGTVSINTRSYSSPVYVVGPKVAPVTVTEWDCQNKGMKNAQLAQQWHAVPIPDYAAPADGSDAEMTIYQPSTDSLWEFWKARKKGEQWQACWGGGMKQVSKNSGIWESPYGATATSLPFIGGQITADELRRGVIGHAIGIALVDLESRSVFSWPAGRSDGRNTRNLPNRIPAGLRFRLNPAVDIDALPLGRAGKIIARAAQTHGFVVWDKAGAITIRAENPKSYIRLGRPNPYPYLFDGKPAYLVLDGFPWERLQFLPMNYGDPKGLDRRVDTPRPANQ